MNTAARTISFAILLGLGVGIAWATEMPTAEDILISIQNEGPRTVIRRLGANQKVFDEICERVASGDPNWLSVAKALRPAYDAAAGESLTISVARALPKAPAGVLSLVGNGFELEDICTSPFIESPREVDLAHLRAAEEALASLKNPTLEEKRKLCIEKIRALRIKIENER